MIRTLPSFRRALTLILLTLLAGVSSTPPVDAGQNAQAGVALHYYGPTSSPHCAISLPYGTSIQTQAYLHSPPWFYAYLLVCNGSTTSGVGKIECGLSYSGRYDANGGGYPVTVFGWTLCADAEAPINGWPAPGGGNAISWAPTRCVRTPDQDGRPNTALGIAGYFYMGAYASVDSAYEMSIAPYPGSGTVRVYDCAGNADTIFPLPRARQTGELGLGANPGYNPCAEFPVPAKTVSWSMIKARMFDKIEHPEILGIRE